MEYIQSKLAIFSCQNASMCVLKQGFGEPNGSKHEQRSRKVTQTAQFHEMVVLVALVHRIEPLPSKGTLTLKHQEKGGANLDMVNCIEAESVAGSVGSIGCYDWLIYHHLECDSFWLIEYQANKQEPKGKEERRAEQEKQARNTTEIKEGKRNAKGNRTNDVTKREKTQEHKVGESGQTNKRNQKRTR
jgi:hypothetical protein